MKIKRKKRVNLVERVSLMKKSIFYMLLIIKEIILISIQSQ